jgi:hypothetical protein
LEIRRLRGKTCRTVRQQIADFMMISNAAGGKDVPIDD